MAPNGEMNPNEKIRLTRVANALVYFASHTDRCGVTKANKLLYYLDCIHLERYGRVVTKDHYKKLPQGPVPDDAYDRLKALAELAGDTEEASPFAGVADFHEFLSDYLRIELVRLSEEATLRKLVPIKDFEPKWFSQSEIAVLKELAVKYRRTSAKLLSEATHSEAPYQGAYESGPVDLKLFVKDKVSEQQYREIEQIEQEERAMEITYG